VTPLRDSEGRVTRWFGTNTDISEKREAEENIAKLNAELEDRVVQRTSQLVNANRELQNAYKEIEAFSYSVSHDLRAPLRAIDGFSNAVLKLYQNSLDARGQDYLNRIRTAAQRMAQLIDDILGLSRAGRAEMRMQRVDVSAMALDIIGDLRKSQPEREVEVIVEPGLTIDADAHLMSIALGNLLGNAWKFTGNRPVARIEFGSFEQNGERIYFVRDNGAGFNPEYADKLFSAFQRLHSESEFPGTGIGLALVQRILRRHGGRVWAESAVDQGATFYFTMAEVNK
jgi:light-regulated signal transduction histidine kinase (bacteriophytochrome)